MQISYICNPFENPQGEQSRTDAASPSHLGQAMETISPNLMTMTPQQEPTQTQQAYQLQGGRMTPPQQQQLAQQYVQQQQLAKQYLQMLRQQQLAQQNTQLQQNMQPRQMPQQVQAQAGNPMQRQVSERMMSGNNTKIY